MTVALDAAMAAAERQRPLPPTLERMLVSPQGFGLSNATVLQRAICRIADGRPLGELANMPLLANPEAYPAEIRERATLAWAVGDLASLPVGKAPAEWYVVGPIRSGKSLMAAATSVCASQRCDMSQLGPGEIPRVSSLSIRLDNAQAIYQHAHGRVMASPGLRKLLVGEPRADSIVLRHPSGRHVELKMVAGSRAGGALVSRWSAGALFDEFTRMAGVEAVVNFDHERDAVAGRLLPGAQLIGIGSPWAPFGPAFRLVQERWLHPSEDQVIIRAVGPAMNPTRWTPERCAELKRNNPTAYKTDVLGEFSDPVMSLFGLDELAAVTRKAPLFLGPAAGQHYVAIIDPATRGHAWTLIVLTRLLDGRLAVALAREWHAESGKPLSPDRVLKEIAETLTPYRVEHVISDQWAADALADLGYRHRLVINAQAVTSASKVEAFETLRALVLDKAIELSPLPQLGEDLRHVRKRVTQNGVSIDLPEVGKRHCDYAACLALGVLQHVPAADTAPAKPDGLEDWEREDLRELEKTMAEHRRDRGEDEDSIYGEDASYEEAAE